MMDFYENPTRHTGRILENRQVSPSAWVLRFERGGMRFLPGHEILLHGRDHTEDRQYSLSGAAEDEHLEILYRLIPEGVMTPQLVTWQPGQEISFTGPFGSFLLRDFLAPMVFVATGTGIAPALSFARSHPGLDLTVLHGVREEVDLFGEGILPPDRYLPCISRQADTRHRSGRVTDAVLELDFQPDTHFYLCGANDMILETRRILLNRGIPDSHIFSEAYYFW